MTAPFLLPLGLPTLSADPESPSDGAVWGRSDKGHFRGRIDGGTVRFIEATWPGITLGRWYPTQAGPSSTVAPTNNRAYFIPFMVPTKCLLTGVAMEISTAATTGNARAGLAGDSGDLLPSSFLNDFGTVAINTVGVKTWAPGAPPTLKANTIYHAVIATQGYTGSPQVRMAQGMHPWIAEDAVTPNLNATLSAYYMSSVSGAFSGAVTVAGVVGGPRVSLKFG